MMMCASTTCRDGDKFWKNGRVGFLKGILPQIQIGGYTDSQDIAVLNKLFLNVVSIH